MNPEKVGNVHNLKEYRAEKLKVLKNTVAEMATDFFGVHNSVNLIWDEATERFEKVFGLMLIEEDWSNTKHEHMIDFAQYLRAHKPAALEPYHITFIEETDNALAKIQFSKQ